MQVTIELSLRTPEVYQLFTRRIKGDRFFIDAILHKFNIEMNGNHLNDPRTQAIYKEMEQVINTLTQQFCSDIGKYEELITKKKI